MIHSIEEKLNKCLDLSNECENKFDTIVNKVKKEYNKTEDIDLIYDLLSDDERDYYKINEAYKKYISQYSKEYIELSEYYYGPELPYSIYCREFKKYNGTYLDSSKDINELYALFLFFAMYHYTLSEVTGVAKK